MDFLTMRELRGSTATLNKRLKKNKDLVLTSNGKPMALIFALKSEDLEETLSILRQTRAQMTLRKIRERARRSGVKHDLASINKEIKLARKEMIQRGYSP